jgi:transcriptional regulator with XRE-family HTH domain
MYLITNKELIGMTIDIGTRIKELRKLAGLSQEELGRRVGVQRAAINKYEKGTVTNIPIHTIEQMAIIFDVSPTYLVGWNTNQGNELAIETKIVQGVHQIFGKDALDMLEMFVELNPQGKKRVMEYIIDVSRIADYHN